MTLHQFWQKCREFDWGALYSLDADEFMDAREALTDLRVTAVLHGTEFEHMLSRFRKAHEFAHMGFVIPNEPNQHIGGTDETSGEA